MMRPLLHYWKFLGLAYMITDVSIKTSQFLSYLGTWLLSYLAEKLRVYTLFGVFSLKK